MPEPLEPGRAHHRDEVSDVQRVGGRVEADIGRKPALLQPFGQPGGRVLEQAAGRQSFEQFGHSRQWYPLE